MDVADGGVPISCLVSSASLHDSQAAIPLAIITGQRVDHCNDLMDSAYDAKEIRAHSTAAGHVPIIDTNPRNRKAAYRSKLEGYPSEPYCPHAAIGNNIPANKHTTYLIGSKSH